MNKILIAKPLIKDIYLNLKEEIKTFEFIPKMVMIIVGNDPASVFYVSNVKKRAVKLGVELEIKQFENISEEDLLKEIDSLNNNSLVHGIMLQKPFPKDINEDIIINRINPMKDLDGFHPINIGNLFLDKEGFVPCTAAAVVEMINYYNIETLGKEIVIIGRSNIVGKPLAVLLLRKNKLGNATVTVCHSRTKNLKDVVKRADIVVAAIGKAEFVTSDMLKDDAIVLDVGVNSKEKDGKNVYVGDVDFDGCINKISMITPVPGGVGSVTTATLFKNLVKACSVQNGGKIIDKK